MVEPWTSGELLRIAPGCKDPEQWAALLAATARVYDILDTPRRLCMWTATLCHESADLQRVEENLDYTPLRIRQVWPGRFATQDAARLYARNPEALANRVYANRMGNGPEESGDGWRYRGRGLIQITGRQMYARCAQGLAVQLLEEPDRLLDPELAALSAGWYWAEHGCNELADRGTFDDVTRAVNGGLTGIDARRASLRRAEIVNARRLPK